jgi:hypothetical protein
LSAVLVLWHRDAFPLPEVLHEPLEDLEVAVDRDVNVFDTCLVRKVLLKVFHMSHKKVFFTTEILIHFPVLVKDMDHDDLLLLIST